MSKPQSGTYSAAIERARAELKDVEHSLVGWQELMKRREILQATIANLSWLAGQGEAPALNQPAIPGASGGNGKALLWETIRDYLTSATGAKTPAEIAAGIGKSGKNGREVVRQALRRRKDVFSRIVGGRYRLKALLKPEMEAEESEAVT